MELIGALERFERSMTSFSRVRPSSNTAAGHAQPLVEAFFRWCHDQGQCLDLVSSSPFAKALVYAGSRQAELRVSVGDPDAPSTPSASRGPCG